MITPTSATALATLLDDRANYVDPSGRPVLLVVLLFALLVGATLGALGAAANRVKTWDEFLLWVIGGAIGGVLAVLGWTGIAWALFELDASVATTAAIGLILFATAALLGAVVSPLLDDTDSQVAWLSSFLIKWVQSPLLTTVGLAATLIVAMGAARWTSAAACCSSRWVAVAAR